MTATAARYLDPDRVYLQLLGLGEVQQMLAAATQSGDRTVEDRWKKAIESVHIDALLQIRNDIARASSYLVLLETDGDDDITELERACHPHFAQLIQHIDATLRARGVNI